MRLITSLFLFLFCSISSFAFASTATNNARIALVNDGGFSFFGFTFNACNPISTTCKTPDNQAAPNLAATDFFDAISYELTHTHLAKDYSLLNIIVNQQALASCQHLEKALPAHENQSLIEIHVSAEGCSVL